MNSCIHPAVTNKDRPKIHTYSKILSAEKENHERSESECICSVRRDKSILSAAIAINQLYFALEQNIITWAIALKNLFKTMHRYLIRQSNKDRNRQNNQPHIALFFSPYKVQEDEIERYPRKFIGSDFHHRIHERCVIAVKEQEKASICGFEKFDHIVNLQMKTELLFCMKLR